MDGAVPGGLFLDVTLRSFARSSRSRPAPAGIARSRSSSEVCIRTGGGPEPSRRSLGLVTIYAYRVNFRS
jgi:hypothetical protein